MFVDEVSIYIKAGKGGDGCVSFRREKYVPRGGPDGGNGGRGGSVLLIADRNVGSLLDLRKKQKYIARNGQPGQGHNRFGAAGEDLEIRVPIGTVVRNADSGEVMTDLTSDEQEVTLAAGGRGGRGNKTFATAINQTPREFTYGTPGEEYNLDLELKLIADIGLVGLPNAGKSTILSRLSEAEPKIANYPFTTLEPQLGLVKGRGFRSLVMADIPGLIAGAHDGAGLGIEFLRHIERTSILAHVVDLVPFDGTDPLENYRVIEGELSAFSEELARRPRVIIGNKMDLPDAEVAVEMLRSEIGCPVIPISAVSGQGLDGLLDALFQALGEQTDAAEDTPQA
ncbi:MAG: GTPase ObgE [Planctomycetota bacterium]|jgi:GTP-binding protein